MTQRLLMMGPFVLSTAVFAAPTTPDRPGRPTPDQAGQPGNPPASQPANHNEPATTRPNEGGSNGQSDLSDADFLKETAREMAVPTDMDRPDLYALKWFGLRPKLESTGVTVAGNITLDESKNFQGGLSTSGNSFRNLLDIRVNVDTRALFGLYGGTFSIDFQNQAGSNASDHLIGDVQGIDNADADGRTQISELWYQQTFFTQRLRLKVGKVDANSEFAFPEYGAPFVNSSFGHSPTLFAMPTYPDPAMSVNLFVYPTRFTYAGVGVYDGSGAIGIDTGSYGPRRFFNGGGDYFIIGEVGARWVFNEDTMPGRIVGGGWRSTADFAKFDGSTTNGTGGVYAILEQTIWHKNFYDKTGTDGVAAFLQYGHADPHVSAVSDHVGGGATWSAPWQLRRDDIVGVGATYAHLSHEAGAGFAKDFELSLEAFYSFQATSYLLIKPDIQYVIHPGGTLPDAVVGTVRATIAF